jgi:hypothetical protein
MSPRTKPISQPDPIKKFKLIDLTNNLLQNPLPTTPTQETLEEMEVQGEKKIRREEEVLISKEPIDEPEHFLTAGPGSQDCRDI